ncbi:pyrroline-5-carboxylate reductase [Clostridium aestuarii]|uniref:Pyrroline-5-carboxylate reductase n=1 Tax=Clostridium aestuarii TaxID=338193 RepID=A0ABT4D233_9CLOT|nr:pyrroline-5-carboxylate reductase [Clostridium aestuarii]MCY6485311.1 pyrroline-5-carboxylate reductase [Clostridium aestuarii]
MNKTIGFIGAGNMASAMIKGIVKSNLISPEYIMTSDLDNQKLNKIKEENGIRITNDNIEIAKFSDILYLSVKPNKYKDVIEQIRSEIKEDAIIVTIAAGMTIEKIEEYFEKDIKIVRTMPNTPALVGEGMTALCPNKLVTEEEAEMIEDIFVRFSKVERVKESDIDAVTAVTGSSPAYVYMFIEALADAAVLNGLPRQQAYRMAAQAVYGSAKMVLETGKHPGQLKDEVCSPGGTTIEAVYSLEKNGFRAGVIEAVEECVKKAKNMGK